MYVIYIALIYYVGILKESGASTVGRYSNAWLAWADEFGPCDDRALRCQEAICIALDSAKTGLVPEADPALFKYTKPHYIDSKGRKSTSVLGELYDVAFAASKQLNGFPSISLDMQTMYRISKDTSLDDALRHQQTLDVLAARWSSFVNIFKKQLAIIPNILSSKERKIRVRKVLLDYRSKFESHAASLAQFDHMRLRSVIEDRFLCRQYEEIALDVARRRLASIVYCATYSSHTGHEKNFRSLELCWSVCGNHILKNKIENLTAKSDAFESLLSDCGLRSLICSFT